MKKHWLLAILALASPVLALAQASDNEFLNEKFYFRIGGQALTQHSTSIRVDSETLGRGTELNLERHTGLEETINIVRLDGGYRFSNRHSMAFSYYDIDRTGSRTLSFDVRWAELLFPDGILVESRFRQQILKLSYEYTFLARPKGILAGTFGLHSMSFDAGLRALDLSGTERADTADAPLPALGLQGQYRFLDKWRLVGSMEWLDVQTGDFSGVFSDALVAIEHDTWDRFGLGFGLNSFGLDIRSGDENLKGIIDIQFDSFLVYFKGNLNFNQ